MPHDLTVLDDQSAEFFAAVPSDLIDNLLAQYRGARTQIAHAAALFAGDMGNVVRYFTYGNCGREATKLAPGGRLVAIVPASAVGKDVLPGLNVTWSRVYNNEFAGTSMSVVILVGEKA